MIVYNYTLINPLHTTTIYEIHGVMYSENEPNLLSLPIHIPLNLAYSKSRLNLDI